ncbi:GIY-YIG nuclease family protein [Candidatus Dependentiae bacterium]|nr:GIY-YIG nuclease family protein [Candidatus Dependentiae bacterium]
MLNFYVYILKCRDGSYYTGHTDNIEKRLSEHVSGSVKCYTSNKLPVKLVFMKNFPSRYEALCAERKIKKWTKKF